MERLRNSVRNFALLRWLEVLSGLIIAAFLIRAGWLWWAISVVGAFGLGVTLTARLLAESVKLAQRQARQTDAVNRRIVEKARERARTR